MIKIFLEKQNVCILIPLRSLISGKDGSGFNSFPMFFSPLSSTVALWFPFLEHVFVSDLSPENAQ